MSETTENFTEEQIGDWFAYERVRQSGEFNMFSSAARECTGLSTPEYMFCMTNYDALRKQAQREIGP